MQKYTNLVDLGKCRKCACCRYRRHRYTRERASKNLSVFVFSFFSIHALALLPSRQRRAAVSQEIAVSPSRCTARRPLGGLGAVWGNMNASNALHKSRRMQLVKIFSRLFQHTSFVRGIFLNLDKICPMVCWLQAKKIMVLVLSHDLSREHEESRHNQNAGRAANGSAFVCMHLRS